MESDLETKTVEGIPVNPVLPRRFDSTPNDKRPASHMAWWGVPFVRVVKHDAWPGGLRFDTYCLDGGAWDRPTGWGKFGTMAEAIRCAQGGPEWGNNILNQAREAAQS